MISLGGAGALLFGLSNFLGKIYLQKEKANLDSLQIEYKKVIDKDMSFFERYYTSQFQTYNEIWSALCEVERISENLWVNAKRTDVTRLVKALSKARQELHKGALLFEEEDFRELNNLLDEFEEFRFGKFKIVEMLEGRRLGYFPEEDIQEVINNNGSIRERYKSALEQVKGQLRSQIRGERL